MVINIFPPHLFFHKFFYFPYTPPEKDNIDMLNVQAYESFSYDTFDSIVKNGYPPEKIILGSSMPAILQNFSYSPKFLPQKLRFTSTGWPASLRLYRTNLLIYSAKRSGSGISSVCSVFSLDWTAARSVVNHYLLMSHLQSKYFINWTLALAEFAVQVIRNPIQMLHGSQVEL